MKVDIISYTENEDGSANIEIEADDEFKKAAVQHYFMYLIMAAVDPNNKEYDIKTEADIDKSESGRDPQ